MKYASIVQTLTGGSAPPTACIAPVPVVPVPQTDEPPAPPASPSPVQPKLLLDDPNIPIAIEIIDEIVGQTSLIAMNAALDSCDPLDAAWDEPDAPGLLPFTP